VPEGWLGQHAEPLGEVAQLWPWVQSGELEQVAGDGAANVVDASFLGRDALRFLEGAERFPDLAAHGVGLGEVEQVPGLPLGREADRGGRAHRPGREPPAGPVRRSAARNTVRRTARPRSQVSADRPALLMRRNFSIRAKRPGLDGRFLPTQVRA